MADRKRRVPTADELRQIAALRRAIAQDVAAGRVRQLSLEREAERERRVALRREWRRLLEPEESPQQRLAG